MNHIEEITHIREKAELINKAGFGPLMLAAKADGNFRFGSAHGSKSSVLMLAGRDNVDVWLATGNRQDREVMAARVRAVMVETYGAEIMQPLTPSSN